MTCGLIDISCHLGGAFAPVLAFINAWSWLGWFALGAIIGGILGWRMILAIFTLGIGYWLYDRLKPGYEPVETELPPRDREPAPRKRREPIKADTSIFEDFMHRLGKKK